MCPNTNYLNPPWGSFLTHDLPISSRTSNFRSERESWVGMACDTQILGIENIEIAHPEIKQNSCLQLALLKFPNKDCIDPNQGLIGYLWALYAGNVEDHCGYNTMDIDVTCAQACSCEM